MDDAAVAGEEAAMRVGDDVAQRRDAVWQGHALPPPLPACGERVGVRGSLRVFGERRTRGESPSPGSHLRCNIAEASLRRSFETAAEGGLCLSPQAGRGKETSLADAHLPQVPDAEIGRASCRERV